MKSTNIKQIKVIAFDLMEVILGRLEPDDPTYQDFNKHFDLDDKGFYPWVKEKYHLDYKQAQKRAFDYMDKYYYLTDETVFELSKRYPLALATNHLSAVNLYIEKRGIDKYFTWIINSSVDGVRKPDPDFFKILLNRIGVKPEEILYVDDFIGNTQAAESMGFRVLNFNADHKQTNLRERVESELLKYNRMLEGDTPLLSGYGLEWS